MIETLTDPRVLTGAVLGFVVTVFAWWLAGLIHTAFGDGWRSKARHSLSQKLHDSGYSAWTPLSIKVSRLSLKEPLTPKEEAALVLDSTLVFDAEGTPMNELLPLTEMSEEAANRYWGQKIDAFYAEKNHAPGQNS